MTSNLSDADSEPPPIEAEKARSYVTHVEVGKDLLLDQAALPFQLIQFSQKPKTTNARGDHGTTTACHSHPALLQAKAMWLRISESLNMSGGVEQHEHTFNDALTLMVREGELFQSNGENSPPSTRQPAFH